MILRCQVISKDVLSILKSSTLKFHSKFDKGLNLIGDGKLIFISESKVPFGLTLHLNTFKYLSFVNEQTTITQYHRTLKLGSVIIDFSDALVLDYRIDFGIDRKYARFLFQFLNSKNIESGLGIALNQIQNIPEIQGFYQGDYHNGVHYLCGRGKGLTPSGDDILLGILATMQLFNQVDLDYLTSLNTIRHKQTTAISISYLHYAKQQKYTFVLREFLTSIEAASPALLTSHFNRILQYGHTSGIDTMAGILVGARIIIGENK